MAKEIGVDDLKKHLLILENIHQGSEERFKFTNMEKETIAFLIDFLRANIEEFEEG